MGRLILVVWLLGLPSIWAQTNREIRDILRFGLENQVLDSLRQITLLKDSTFQEEVVSLLNRYQGAVVREAALRYLIEVDSPAPNDRLLAILDDLERWPNPLLLTFSDYVAQFRPQEALERLFPLLETGSTFQRGAVIRLIGRLGLQERTGELREMLRNPETPPELTGDLVLALGRLRDSAAVDEIRRVLEDGASSAALKAQCLEALAAFDTSEVHDLFQRALSDENAIVRSAAIRFSTTLESFPLSAELFVQALRDPSAGVRTAAAEALARRPVSGTEEILAFRASNDPESRVRQAALAALKSVSETEWLARTLQLITSRKSDQQLWGELLRSVFEGRIESALEPLREVLTEDARLPNAPTLNAFAQRYAQTEWPAADSLLPLVFRSQNQTAQITLLRSLQRRDRRDLRPQLEELFRNTRSAQVRNFLQTLFRQWDTP